MYRILVVDDEAPIRRWLEYCIRKHPDFECIGAAANSNEAMALFQKYMPDIIITDIVMPGINGLELLRLMYGINPDLYSIILSSHENFAYAREAVKLGASEYILKTEITEKSLYASVEAAAKALDDLAGSKGWLNHAQLHYFQALILKKEETGNIPDRFRELGVHLQESRFVAVDIRFLENNDVTGLLRSLDSLHNIISIPLNMEETLLIGNLNYNSGIPDLCEVLSSFLSFHPCVLGISRIYSGYSSITDALEEARSQAAMFFYYPEEQLFFDKSPSESRLKHETDFLIHYGKQLIDQEFQASLDTVSDMLTAVHSEKPTDIENLKKTFFSMIVSIIHFTEEDVAEMERYLDDLNFKIQKCMSKKELSLILHEVFQNFENRFYMHTNYSPVIQKSIQFIEEKYPNHISITDVANYVALNADYFSRMFIRETGLRFTVYLNNFRMKKAIHLLENTNLKVYEIAEQVGFSSLSYFSTVFRKHFNQNPYDYQMAHRARKNTDSRIDTE